MRVRGTSESCRTRVQGQLHLTESESHCIHGQEGTTARAAASQTGNRGGGWGRDE